MHAPPRSQRLLFPPGRAVIRGLRLRQVFISPDGTSHYYKEFEMNAFNTSWNLCLNKPYLNGGAWAETR